MKLDDWQRIEKIVHWTGLSVNAFALNVGLNRAENLYQIKRGKNGISKELAELIASKYPEINRVWILTGDGEMLASGGERNMIPFYETDALCLARQKDLPLPAGMITLPYVSSKAVAALIYGRSMDPQIPAGSIVVMEAVTVNDIVPGAPYAVVCDRLAVVRNLRMEPDGQFCRLVAANSDFDEIVLDLSEIRNIFAIRAHIHYDF